MVRGLQNGNANYYAGTGVSVMEYVIAIGILLGLYVTFVGIR